MGNKKSIMGNKESKCYFCGRKIGLNDSFYEVKDIFFVIFFVFQDSKWEIKIHVLIVIRKYLIIF